MLPGGIHAPVLGLSSMSCHNGAELTTLIIIKDFGSKVGIYPSNYGLNQLPAHGEIKSHTISNVSVIRISYLVGNPYFQLNLYPRRLFRAAYSHVNSLGAARIPISTLHDIIQHTDGQLIRLYT